MSVNYGLIPLIVFWIVAVRLWILDGPKIPLIFIALFATGYFGFFPIEHWTGIPFPLFVCFLAIILVLIEKYKQFKRTFA